MFLGPWIGSKVVEDVPFGSRYLRVTVERGRYSDCAVVSVAVTLTPLRRYKDRLVAMRGFAFQQNVVLGFMTIPRQRDRIRHLEMINAEESDDPQILCELRAILKDIETEAKRCKKGLFPMQTIDALVRAHCLLPKERKKKPVLLAS